MAEPEGLYPVGEDTYGGQADTFARLLKRAIRFSVVFVYNIHGKPAAYSYGLP